MKVEATACGQTLAYSSSYTVSDFLELKIACKESTNIAELTASLRAKSEITITDVKFFNSDGASVERKAIGIPLKLEADQVSSLFVLESKVDAAEVWLQQDKMKPFALRISVEMIDSIENDGIQVSPPLTPFVPLDHKI